MIAALLWLGCRSDPVALDAEQIRDSASCESCHPDHVREWSGSMHAYASDDPVFRAMNAEGQRETGGELGDFCVKCHAPVATALGLTVDGTDLDDVPQHLRGVSCWFCHQVDDVAGDHDNPLHLALDDVLRGPIRDPVEAGAHPSRYSSLMDREDPDASALCGACHDIVTPLGAHIEQTYAEWRSSLFSEPALGLGCAGCHMPGRDGLAAVAEGVPLRRVHDHRFPGVDVALTEFPERDDQRAQVVELLDDTVSAWLCVSPPAGAGTLAFVTLENVAAGHLFPSGATADRRVWVQIEAWRGSELLWSSGRTDGTPIGLVTDPDLWRLWSTLLDADGEPTHRFWEAAAIDLGERLPVQTTADPTDPAYVSTHAKHGYLVRGGAPDRITMAVHVEPIGREILDELVASGDLDPGVVDEVPTFTLAPTVLEWTAGLPANSGSLSCVPEAPPAVAVAE